MIAEVTPDQLDVVQEALDKLELTDAWYEEDDPADIDLTELVSRAKQKAKLEIGVLSYHMANRLSPTDTNFPIIATVPPSLKKQSLLDEWQATSLSASRARVLSSRNPIAIATEVIYREFGPVPIQVLSGLAVLTALYNLVD